MSEYAFSSEYDEQEIVVNRVILIQIFVQSLLFLIPSLSLSYSLPILLLSQLRRLDFSSLSPYSRSPCPFPFSSISNHNWCLYSLSYNYWRYKIAVYDSNRCFIPLLGSHNHLRIGSWTLNPTRFFCFLIQWNRLLCIFVLCLCLARIANRDNIRFKYKWYYTIEQGRKNSLTFPKNHDLLLICNIQIRAHCQIRSYWINR